MKKIVFILAAIICYGSASAAEITSIQGPSNICPTDSTMYTVNYTLLFTVPPTVYDRVLEVKWEFIKNGSVIKTLKSSDYVSLGLKGSAKILVNKLPYGDIKIRVKLFYLYTTPYFTTPIVIEESKNIFVGVPDPLLIAGNAICPNSSGTFSVAPSVTATSYTWEVPAGWKVNGVTGPVVTSQGPSVSITPCPFTNDPAQACKTNFYTTYTIKVKGVSTACGTSNYTTKSITIDHPVSITETNLGNNDVRLSASPTNLPSYQWTLDPAWFFPATGKKNLPEVSFNSRGITGLAKLTYTTPCQNTYTREWWWVPPAQPGDPGWPGDPQDPDPSDCEPEIPANPNYSAKSGNVIYLKDPCGEEPPLVSLYANGAMVPVTLTKSFDGYEYDISELNAGAYILRVKSARGKYKSVKFIKLN
jgi:hypothetical protein